MIIDLFIIFWSFIIGTLLGSFINLVVERVHRNENWWSGRSYCENCNKILTWKELIPVFSFFIQKRRCASCKSKLSWQYPLMEIISGVIFALCFYKFVFSAEALILSLLGLCLLGNFISDLKYMELPEIFSMSSIVLAILYQILYGKDSFILILSATVFGFFFFFLQYFFTKGKGLGAGDIRLGVLMGILLSWPAILAGIMISYITGSIVSLILLSLKKLDRKSTVPLGIFLIPGLIITFIFKTQIIDYLNNYILIGWQV